MLENRELFEKIETKYMSKTLLKMLLTGINVPKALLKSANETTNSKI